MGNLIETVINCIVKLVEVAEKNPKETAAIAVALTSFAGGYGIGYHDGRKDSDEVYVRGYLK